MTSNEISGVEKISAGVILRTLVMTLVVAVILFGITFIISPPQYEVVDDVHMTMIVSGTGICDQPDPHMAWSHIVIGKILSWLYRQNSNFPWYGSYLCSANVWSFAVLLTVFLFQRASRTRIALFSACFVFSIAFVWNSLQFTSVALFLGTAASVMILQCFENANFTRSGKATLFTIAGLTMSASAMIRPDCARLSLVLLCVILGYRLIQCSSQTKHTVILVASLITLTEGLNLIDRAYYERDSGWQQFYAFMSASLKVCDYNRVVFTPETAPLFAKVHLSSNDLTLYKKHFYFDPQIYSTEKFNYLLTFFPNHRYELSPRSVLHGLRVALSASNVLPGVLLALFLIPFVDVTRLPRFLLPAAIAGVLVTLLCVMKLEPRVTLPSITWLTIMCAYYCDCEKLKTSLTNLSPVVQASLIATVIIIAVNLEFELWRTSRLLVVQRQEFKSMLSFIRSESTSLYVAAASFPLLLISPFENPAAYLGSMPLCKPRMSPSPLGQRFLADHRVPYNSLTLIKPDVLLLTSQDYIDELRTFFWEHYQLKLRIHERYVSRQFGLAYSLEAVPLTVR